MKNMRLHALLFIGMFLLGFTQMANAQTQLNNSGFENWENVGSATVEPLEWNSFKTASGILAYLYGTTTITRSDSTRPGSTGNYSCLIWSKTVVGIVANGNVTTGQINMGSQNAGDPSNYNITHTANTAFSEALGAHPDSLVFWAMFNPVTADTAHLARVRAIIHDSFEAKDPVDAATQPHVVGDATLNFPSTNKQWERISIPFHYTGPATSPDYMLLTFTTNKTPGGGSGGDSLFIDDLELIYNPNGINNIDQSNNFNVYTDNNDIIINLSFEKIQTSRIAVYNMSGQLVYRTQITAQNVQHYIGLNEFKSGIYLVTVNTDDGRTFSQKIPVK